MEFIILFIIIFSIALSIRNILKRKIEETIPISVVFITIVIYIGGLFDNLNVGVLFVYIGTFLSFLYNLFYFIRINREGKIKEELKLIFTPGFFIYLFLFIFFSYFNRKMILEDYDDFNHWGLIIKNMFYYNGYGTVSNSRVTFNEYPPFTANFEYLLLKIGGLYIEDRILIAQNILYLSLIIFITKNLKFKKNLLMLFFNIIIIFFVPLIFFRAFYYNLLVDGLLGVLFALGLFIIYEDKKELYNLLLFISILSGLSLIKSTGIVLAIFLIIVFFIKRKINRESEKIAFKNILLLLIPIILVCSWFLKINLSKNSYEWDISSAIKMKYTVKDENLIKKKFFDAFLNKKEFTFRNISLLYCIVALIGLSIYTYSLLKNKKDKKNFIYILIVHSIVFIIFFLGLLWVYLTFFLNFESESLNSYVRYLSTFLLSWMFFNCFIISSKNKLGLSNFYILIIIMLFFVPFDTLKDRYLYKDKFVVDLMNQKSSYTTIERYKNILNKNDRVFFYSNYVNPFVVKINRYEFFDINIINCDGNFNGSKDEFMKMVLENNIDYVYIWRILPDITEKYRTLFDENFIKDETLYKVIKRKDKELELKEVNN